MRAVFTHRAAVGRGSWNGVTFEPAVGEGDQLMDHMQAPTRAADRLYRTRRELLGLTELPNTLLGFDDRAAWGLAWLDADLWWKRKGRGG